MSAKENRIYYLDMAKGIGIVLVILGHISDLTISSREFITSFHMPLFFLISGILISVSREDEREMGDIVRRKARSIMVPYYVFSLLCLIVEALCTGFLKNGTWKVFREHVFATICLSGASVFWFLPALFFSELIFLAVLKKWGKRYAWLPILLIAIAAYAGLMVENHFQDIYGNLSWYYYFHLFTNAFWRVFFLPAFLMIGYYSYEVLKRLPKRPVLFLLVGIVLLVITWFVSHVNGVTDMNYMIFNNIGLYLITANAGSFGLILICFFLEDFAESNVLSFVRYIGRNSLIIMMTHSPFYILYAATRFSYGINNHFFPLGQVALCGLITVTVILIEIPVIWVLDRYFPFLLGRKKKRSN